MIKKAFIDKQAVKAQNEQRTPDFLRRLCFTVVESVLRQHYSDSYSMRCLQASLAISSILKRLGIKSQTFVGEVCVSQVFCDSKLAPNWNGFWGDDHHVWLMTEFGELVDLTIKYLHLHPVTKGNSQLEMPAIWWSDVSRWPHVIKYLPQGAISVKLPNEEMIDLDVFLTKVDQELSQFLKSNSVQQVVFSPVLHGPESMNDLYSQGNPWLVRSAELQDGKLPYPQKVLERERELLASCEK
ncbi:hypothetical protein AB4242_11550 [Vibrio splendidus]|uniref:hypothetical protein n=1 Tax=Vibrio TaxID=662 RepID=UPI000D39B75B|nr:MULTISPECIES: hypothetical protein [Vibrio]PTP73556.1 hypothetical protein CWO23_06315 [Vibrio splendidus]TKE99281.1 hypothetical protein FCV46_19035 [Vibrio kanaloae]TKF62421.1 hypothetical protein FCV51_08430 [Vibrio kanaloae]